MSYTSENTKVLETHQDGDNLRMLLLHEHDSGRLEYIIGSYFQRNEAAKQKTVECHECGAWFGIDGAIAEYSWDWGHYFGNVVSAVDYWKREVLPHPDEDTCPHCGVEGELELEQVDDVEAPKAYWYRCLDCGGLSKQVWSLAENVPVEG